MAHKDIYIAFPANYDQSSSTLDFFFPVILSRLNFYYNECDISIQYANSNNIIDI